MAFNARKAAHMSAYFLLKSGGTIEYLKLIKLLYLAERESYRRCGWGMCNDELVSMPYGPVLSKTLNLIHRDIYNSETWNNLISPRKEKHYVSLARTIEESDLRILSVANCEILEKIWKDFGHMRPFDLVDYTHDPKNCPEWKDPGRSSNRIPLETLFEALGYSQEEIKCVLEDKKRQDLVDSFLDSI